MITTVIFDLDDTLYDEIDYYRSGFRAVARFLADQAKTINENTLFEAFWQQFVGGNRNRTFNAALDQLGIPYNDELIQRLIEVLRNHRPALTLPDDTRDTLERLKMRYTLALLTDGFLPAQQLKVEALGIGEYFRHIIYTEQLGRQFWKPSTAGFEKLLQNLEADPKKCVYVADNAEKDFIAPKKLGFAAIQIKRPAGIHRADPATPEAAAGYSIIGLAELPSLLEKL